MQACLSNIMFLLVATEVVEVRLDLCFFECSLECFPFGGGGESGLLLKAIFLLFRKLNWEITT